MKIVGQFEWGTRSLRVIHGRDARATFSPSQPTYRARTATIA
jgi:hypothetical protein